MKVHSQYCAGFPTLCVTAGPTVKQATLPAILAMGEV
jgi:hypothetical protein